MDAGDAPGAEKADFKHGVFLWVYWPMAALKASNSASCMATLCWGCG